MIAFAGGGECSRCGRASEGDCETDSGVGRTENSAGADTSQKTLEGLPPSMEGTSSARSGGVARDAGQGLSPAMERTPSARSGGAARDAAQNIDVAIHGIWGAQAPMYQQLNLRRVRVLCMPKVSNVLNNYFRQEGRAMVRARAVERSRVRARSKDSSRIARQCMWVTLVTLLADGLRRRRCAHPVCRNWQAC